MGRELPLSTEASWEDGPNGKVTGLAWPVGAGSV